MIVDKIIDKINNNPKAAKINSARTQGENVMKFSHAGAGIGFAAALLGTVANAENTLRWAAPLDIFSLDPVSYGSTVNLAFLNHVYEGLVVDCH